MTDSQAAGWRLPPQDDEALGRLLHAENRLEALHGALDFTGDSTIMGIVALAVGHRARSLYRGVRHAVEGPSEATAQIALRVLIEQTILLPWLLLLPKVHPFLWKAEHERQIRSILTGAPGVPGGAFATALSRSVSPSRQGDLDRAVSEARQLALTNGVVGVGRNGSLLPSLDVMTAQVGTPEAQEAYHVAYRMTSGWIHTSAGGLALTVTSAGVRFGDERLEDSKPIRSMAAASYLYILEIVSREAGLGIEDEAASLRRSLLGP